MNASLTPPLFPLKKNEQTNKKHKRPLGKIGQLPLLFTYYFRRRTPFWVPWLRLISQWSARPLSLQLLLFWQRKIGTEFLLKPWQVFINNGPFYAEEDLQLRANPVWANRFFFPGILTEYFNCKYFPICTPERLGYLPGISPSGRNPCGGNSVRYSV